MQPTLKRRHAGPPLRAAVLAAGLGSWCMPCFAASGELVDTVATFLAVFIIVAMPIAGIAIFWLVHVLPEKIAEKRHHPQKDAIHVLCLLSLVFGGLLWPLAWLWAYTKPVLHKMAYGRDRHDDYYAVPEADGGESTSTGGAGTESTHTGSVSEELERLRHELDELDKRAGLSDETRGIRARLARIEAASGHTRGGQL